MECISKGVVHLTLKKFKEHYTWDKVNSVICKAMYANRYLEYRGELKVTEANSGKYKFIFILNKITIINNNNNNNININKFKQTIYNIITKKYI